MNDRKELKPCPFCGSDDIHIKEPSPDPLHEWLWGYQAWCLECEALAAMANKKEDAIESWNRRAVKDDKLIVGIDMAASGEDKTVVSTNVDRLDVAEFVHEYFQSNLLRWEAYESIPASDRMIGLLATVLQRISATTRRGIGYSVVISYVYTHGHYYYKSSRPMDVAEYIINRNKWTQATGEFWLATLIANLITEWHDATRHG